ncbi:AzlC family ABC transporter permease [Streptomyces sp. NPDC002722]|uniref:AzlC family ABC transporter permease n=1 Tax=unclassified Streptomyces TaxID=2593676 RepID=UPI0033223011
MRTSPAAVGNRPRSAPVPLPPGRSEARAAFKDSAGAILGFVPLGLAFGALAAQSGLEWWWAGLSAALAFGGSFEFLLIGLVTAAVPLAAIALSTFMVNVRHVFYALSFPLQRITGRLGKTYAAFALCDEAYALATANQARSWTSRRILWLQLYLHLCWTASAITGALLGSLIPNSVTGLDFALTAMFTVLALDAIRDMRGDLPTPALALISAAAARLLFPAQMLPAAFTLFTATLLARHYFTTKRPRHA